MPLKIHWRLPPAGDGRDLSPATWHRGDHVVAAEDATVFSRTGRPRDGLGYYDQLALIARAAEQSGFDGVWIEQSGNGEEPQVAAAGLAREASRLRFLTSLCAPLQSAVYAAKIAVSFQRLSGGRLDWHFAFEDAGPRPWHGRRFSVDEQVARTDEFLHLVRGFWNDAPFTWQGRHFEVENGGFPPALQGQPLPRIHIDVSRDEALALAARHADVALLPLLPPEALRARIDQLRAIAATQGRQPELGVTVDILARDDGPSAWSELRRQWRAARARTVSLAGTSSSSHDEGLFDDLVVDANLWSGFGSLRGGASHGLVGSHADIARRLAELVDLGVTTLILSSHPHLEQAYRLADHIVPALRRHVAQPLASAA